MKPTTKQLEKARIQTDALTASILVEFLENKSKYEAVKRDVVNILENEVLTKKLLSALTIVSMMRSDYMKKKGVDPNPDPITRTIRLIAYQHYISKLLAKRR